MSFQNINSYISAGLFVMNEIEFFFHSYMEFLLSAWQQLLFFRLKKQLLFLIQNTIKSDDLHASHFS
jgi:hypothetical protein